MGVGVRRGTTGTSGSSRAAGCSVGNTSNSADRHTKGEFLVLGGLKLSSRKVTAILKKTVKNPSLIQMMAIS